MLTLSGAHRLGCHVFWNTRVAGGVALALSLALATQAAAQQSAFTYPTMDLDNNGRVSVDDFIEYSTLRMAGNRLADLNFDGSISTDDDAIAIQSIGSAWPVPREFSVHWSVTGENDPRIDPVNLGSVEVVRDVEVIYQPNVPLYPVSGYHEMIRNENGSYDNWITTYNTYMSNYLAQVRVEVRRRQKLQRPGTIGIIDYESASPDWAFINMNQQALVTRWRSAVAQVNGEALDLVFVTFSGFTPDPGADSWGTLSGAQKEDLLRLSWNAFGRDLFTRTLELAREDAPAALWGYWGIPRGMVNVPISSRDIELNDNLAWLIEQVDVLCPAFYDAPRVEEGGPSSACPTVEASRLVTWLTGNMAELLRVRHLYNQNARLLPYIWYHNGPNTCIGSEQPGRMISETNARALLTIPKFMGADGVLLWGHFYPTEPAPEHASPEEVQGFVDQWTWLINSLHRSNGRPTQRSIRVP